MPRNISKEKVLKFINIPSGLGETPREILEHDFKSKILDLYEDGRYTQKELANRFKISDRTIKRWIQNKKNNKNLSRKERKYESYR